MKLEKAGRAEGRGRGKESNADSKSEMRNEDERGTTGKNVKEEHTHCTLTIFHPDMLIQVSLQIKE